MELLGAAGFDQRNETGRREKRAFYVVHASVCALWTQLLRLQSAPISAGRCVSVQKLDRKLAPLRNKTRNENPQSVCDALGSAQEAERGAGGRRDALEASDRSTDF